MSFPGSSDGRYLPSVLDDDFQGVWPAANIPTQRPQTPYGMTGQMQPSYNRYNAQYGSTNMTRSPYVMTGQMQPTSNNYNAQYGSIDLTGAIPQHFEPYLYVPRIDDQYVSGLSANGMSSTPQEGYNYVPYHQQQQHDSGPSTYGISRASPSSVAAMNFPQSPFERESQAHEDRLHQQLRENAAIFAAYPQSIYDTSSNVTAPQHQFQSQAGIRRNLPASTQVFETDRQLQNRRSELQAPIPQRQHSIAPVIDLVSPQINNQQTNDLVLSDFNAFSMPVMTDEEVYLQQQAYLEQEQRWARMQQSQQRQPTRRRSSQPGVHASGEMPPPRTNLPTQAPSHAFSHINSPSGSQSLMSQYIPSNDNSTSIDPQHSSPSSHYSGVTPSWGTRGLSNAPRANMLDPSLRETRHPDVAVNKVPSRLGRKDGTTVVQASTDGKLKSTAGGASNRGKGGALYLSRSNDTIRRTSGAGVAGVKSLGSSRDARSVQGYRSSSTAQPQQCTTYNPAHTPAVFTNDFPLVTSSNSGSGTLNSGSGTLNSGQIRGRSETKLVDSPVDISSPDVFANQDLSDYDGFFDFPFKPQSEFHPGRIPQSLGPMALSGSDPMSPLQSSMQSSLQSSPRPAPQSQQQPPRRRPVNLSPAIPATQPSMQPPQEWPGSPKLVTPSTLKQPSLRAPDPKNSSKASSPTAMPHPSQQKKIYPWTKGVHPSTYQDNLVTATPVQPAPPAPIPRPTSSRAQTPTQLSPQPNKSPQVPAVLPQMSSRTPVHDPGTVTPRVDAVQKPPNTRAVRLSQTPTHPQQWWTQPAPPPNTIPRLPYGPPEAFHRQVHYPPAAPSMPQETKSVKRPYTPEDPSKEDANQQIQRAAKRARIDAQELGLEWAFPHSREPEYHHGEKEAECSTCQSSSIRDSALRQARHDRFRC